MTIRSRLTPARLTTTILLAGIAGFAGLYLASIGPYWNISADSVSYVGWGSSLAAGTGWGSPPLLPPLTAILFAAVRTLVPTGYTALNAVPPLLILLALAFAWVLLERRGGRNMALLAILLSLAATPVYRASTQLLSEPLYMVFSMAALLLLDGYPDRKARGGLRTWVAGICIIAAILTRTVGIALALAVLLGEGGAWLLRRRRPGLVLSGFALAAIASIPIWQAYSGARYASSMFSSFVLRDPWAPDAGRMSPPELLERLRDNLELLPRAGGMLLNGWAADHHTLELLLQVAGVLAIAWGLALALRRRAGITELYLAIYLAVVAMHMLSGSGGEYRFLVPVAPLLFYYALEAARHAGRAVALAYPGRGSTLLLAGLAGFLLFGYLRIGWDRAVEGVAQAHSSPFGGYPIKRPENFDIQQLALWIKHNSGPEDRYASGQRDMFDVITERRGEDILLVHTHPPEALVARLEQRRVRFLLVDRTGGELGESLLAVVRTHPRRFRLIRELPGASLYELQPKPKDADAR